MGDVLMKVPAQLFLFMLIISACTPVAQSNVDASFAPAIEERQDFGYFLAWSPDDRLLSVTTNTGLYLYDTGTFEQVAAFPGISGSTVDLSNEYISAINHDGMYLWDRKDFNLLFQEKASDPIQFQRIALSPDGKWLASGEQNQFRLWQGGCHNSHGWVCLQSCVHRSQYINHNSTI
jgi:WD40 repeat protein